MKFHEAILVGIVKNFVVEALSTCRVKSHENLASERGTNRQQRIFKSPHINRFLDWVYILGKP